MKKDAHKVGISVAIGAAFGALVASKLGSWYWIIGPLLGLLVGYLSYEFKAVIRAIPVAWRAARGWRPTYRKTIPRLIWWSLLAWFEGLFYPIAAIAALTNVWKQPGDIYMAFVTLLGFTAVLFWSSLCPIEGDDSLSTETIEKRTVLARKFFFYAFPPITAYFILRGIAWVIIRLPRAIFISLRALVLGVVAVLYFFGRFGWHLFVRIHSEKRLICAADALLGATIGHLAGKSSLAAMAVAAVAGYFLGFVNYAVVTERWLKPRGYIRTTVS